MDRGTQKGIGHLVLRLAGYDNITQRFLEDFAFGHQNCVATSFFGRPMAATLYGLQVTLRAAQRMGHH